MAKTQIDLTRQLSPQTHAAILSFLETQPLGKVYGLFQAIINELTQVPADHARADDSGVCSAPTGGGDPYRGSDSVLPLEVDKGSG